MLAISNDTHLIPLQQVVCDFGSVVAWGLIDDGEMSRARTRETRENQEISRRCEGLKAFSVFINGLVSCLANERQRVKMTGGGKIEEGRGQNEEPG